MAVYRAELGNLQALYGATPAAVACDLHPDYVSTRHARAMGLPVLPVQHHYAHVAACMAENAVEGCALGVAWDGTGYGPDGTIWGGEFLAVTATGFSRVACLRPFRLPGGERAVREPRRSAIGLLHAMLGARAGALDTPTRAAFADGDRALILRALAQGLNAPVTTSAGRLFDAVASLIGLRQHTSFEGQSAMALEFAVDERVGDAYPFAILTGPARPSLGTWDAPEFVVDWEPAVLALLADHARAVAVGTIAARFHNTLAQMIVAVAARVGESHVVLGGGCFQNRYLVERTVACLRASGFRPYWPQRVPPNDGGIAFGQIAACVRSGAIDRVEPARMSAEAGVAATSR
jgi:hydrogenase maturation protein HypF